MQCDEEVELEASAITLSWEYQTETNSFSELRDCQSSRLEIVGEVVEEVAVVVAVVDVEASVVVAVGNEFSHFVSSGVFLLPSTEFFLARVEYSEGLDLLMVPLLLEVLLSVLPLLMLLSLKLWLQS